MSHIKHRSLIDRRTHTVAPVGLPNIQSQSCTLYSVHDTLAFPATSITQNVSAAYLLNVWIVYGVYNTDDRSKSENLYMHLHVRAMTNSRRNRMACLSPISLLMPP